MTNIAVCDKNPIHAVKGLAKDIEGKDCQASGCEGTYQVIRLKGTGAPRNYKGDSATVEFKGKRVVAKALMLSDRQLMKDSLKGAERRRRAQQIERMRAIVRDEMATDVEDGGDYIGEAAPFKGVYSRLSHNGHYQARGNLATIVANCKPNKLKIRLSPVQETQHRGSGQTHAKGQRSAEATSGRNLPRTTLKNAKGIQSPAPWSEEWCHLQASCLGGQTVTNNLVAASYACNTYMMAIETYIKGRNELSISVSAYCADNACDVAEAIRYRIYTRGKNGATQLLDVLIDATCQHFSETDLNRLKADLKRSVPVSTIGV